MVRDDVPRQLPLDLARDAARSRDDLVVSASNAAAVEMIDRWPDWPAPVVLLAGPAGSGKSHLAAIWAEMSGAVPVDPSAVGEAAIDAAGRGPVLIDDADSGAIDENGLFHLLNALRESGFGLLVTARRFPAAWGVALPAASAASTASASNRA